MAFVSLERNQQEIKIKHWPLWFTRHKFIRWCLRRKLIRRFLGHIGPKYMIYEINQCRFFCNLRDFTGMAHYFLKNDQYEPYITKLIMEYAHPHQDFMDVGANIGYYSILCSKRTTGKVYCFEPEPENFNVLVNNIRLNNAGNINPMNVALGNQGGHLDFYVNHFNKGDHRCYKSDDHKYDSIRVDAKRIDQILTKEEFDRIRLIKIDVQGYEMKVCQGMAMYLKGAEDLRIISELESSFMRQAGDEPRNYLQFMTENGFKIFIIDEERQVLIPARINEVMSWLEKCANSNILFQK